MAIRWKGWITPQFDVNHQSQRIDIVLEPSIDVGDRYSPATSSCPTTAIPQCMVLRSLCFVKRQAAKKWAFLSQLSELSYCNTPLYRLIILYQNRVLFRICLNSIPFFLTASKIAFDSRSNQ